jgi:serine O-acetyltransferase
VKLGSALRAMVAAVRADHAMLRHYDAKYAHPGSAEGPEVPEGQASLPRDLVVRAGFQMLAACRAMRFCKDAGFPLAPQIASRLIRHVYGSDVHWEADLEPGIVVVHGMGLAVSRAARVRRGAILSQHVTLGMGIDPETRAHGAPTIERDAQVGAGSTLVGPITVGARSKITPNCFVRGSIPADSLVEAPAPTITSRERRGDGARREANR